ncbi:uncharacterized protein LOC120932922 isoform X3 [Rana temporaria]|uniref:uncharacterized protein LOC120932922 isoform X3 n=1 Tax=Rana temporaria TaxID=8407 RepID=UPI001AAC5767|nr:uncharacterized protein LOC120932922 isoform X3 [Rana temporaria]
MLMYAKARRTKKYCCYERNSRSRPKLPPYTHTSPPSPLFPFCFFGLYHRECKQLTVTKERKSPADVFIRMNRKKKGIQIPPAARQERPEGEYAENQDYCTSSQ